MGFVNRITSWLGGNVLSQGYEASRIGRRLRGWNAEKRTINALLLSGGDQLRARARQLCRENPYASNACETFTAATVGAGIKPSPLIDDVDIKTDLQKAWLRWTDEADADGITDFYGLQALAVRAMFEAGECFIRFRPRRLEDGLSVPLQIQLLESEMLPFSKNEQLEGGNTVREGIEYDLIGRRVAYHFLTSHPGEVYPILPNIDTVRVPASEILHLYKPIRPGQIRGQPQITPSMVRLYLLDLYDDAELDRKRVAAMFAGFVTKTGAEAELPVVIGTTDEGTAVLPAGYEIPAGAALGPMEPGTLQVLNPGEDIKFSTPAEVGGSYEAFMWRNLLAISAGCGVPYTGVTGDSSKSNYSSSREQQVEFRRRTDQVQHLVVVFQMCRPIYERWLETAILSKAVAIKVRDYRSDPAKFLAVRWIAPKWEWVDPYKDRKAEQIAVQEGFKSRSDVVEAEGYDPEENDKRIQADRQREVEMGLDFRPVQERLNLNVTATAADVGEAIEQAEGRGQGEEPPAAEPPPVDPHPADQPNRGTPPGPAPKKKR